MLTIHKATSPGELEAIGRFRYAVYVEEMGRPQKYADHKRRMILDPLDCEGVVNLAAWQDGQVIGVIRNNFVRLTDIGDYFQQYGLAGVSPELLEATSITTRLMVHSSHRKSLLGARLACSAYRSALGHGIKTDFMDCNEHLVPYFTALGYRVHRDDLVHPEYGAVTVMRLDLTDRDHLEKVRSPFRKQLLAWSNDQRELATA